MSPGVAWVVVAALMACGVSSDDLLDNVKDTKPPGMHICLNYFKMCPDHLDVPSTYDNLELIMDPEDQDTIYINGELNMKEDIPVDAKLLLNVKKCENENEDSCLRYYEHEVKDICSYLPQEDQVWTLFIQHIQGLSSKCPIPAGSYKMEEAPVNVSSYSHMTEFAGHWQMDVSFVNSEKRYGCIVLDVTVHMRRKGEEINC